MLKRASSVAETVDSRGTNVRLRPSASLAFKLALLAVAPFVVLSMVLLLGVTYQFERLSEMTIGSQEMEISSPVVQGIEAAVRNAHDSLTTAAGRIANLPDFDEPSLRQALGQEDQLRLFFSEGLLVTDAKHHVLASVGPVQQKRDEQPGYSFPSPSANYLVSPPFEALSMPRHPAVAQSAPISKDGQLRGYLSGASDLFGSRFLGPYRNTRFGALGYFSLTTPDRILFLHKDPNRILHYGGPPGLNRAIDRGLEGWEGWMDTTTAAGPMITAIRQIHSTGWILSVHYPKTVAESPFLTARRDLLVALALEASVLLAIVLFLSRRMLRPLSAMTRQVEALTDGTSDVLLVPVSSRDEIGILTKAFNRLVRERSAAEKELRASEERFRLAFRTSPEPMSLTRLADNVLVAVNEGFERLFQVREADVLGRRVEDLGIRIEAPDRTVTTGPFHDNGIPRNGLLRATTASGRRLDLSVSSNLMNVRGENHVLAMSRDVTALRAAEAERERLTQELRASEERYRRVVRNVPVVQWALDNEGVFTLAEGLGLLSLGRRSEQMVGSNIFSLYADNRQMLEYFARARDGHVVSGSFEQDRAAFESHWGPLRDESGGIVGVTAIALDVTERRKAETARRETESRMVVLERLAATGRLAAGVAHEINNPLTYVISNLEEIQAGIAYKGSDDPIRQCAREAMDGATRVAAIVRDLRVFSGRPQQGQPRCRPAKVVDSAVALIRNQIRHRSRLEVDCRPTPDAAIEEGRLAQVLVNLLMNACHAIPEGNVEGNLIRLVVAHASPWITVEVSDTGEGIASEVIPHLFEPFFTTRRIGEGSGLGLSVSYGIVTEVGGSIEVDSAKGQGATFTLRLPVAQGAATSTTAESPKAPDSNAKRLRILVVDDDPPVGRALSRYLREFDVAIESRAKIALERLRGGERFDAILADMMMPEMSGIQFYEHLRRELPEVSRKVMFMSGGAFGPEAQAFTDSAKPTVYEKPLDMRLLLSHLHDLAESREGRDPEGG
jgi:PAS domain S-box-containing protein